MPPTIFLSQVLLTETTMPDKFQFSNFILTCISDIIMRTSIPGTLRKEYG